MAAEQHAARNVSAPVGSARSAASDDPLRQRNEIWRAATLLKTVYGPQALDQASQLQQGGDRNFGRQVASWLEYEQHRLAVLRGLKVLGSELDPIFDELVAIAAAACATPIASINLIDDAREWRVATVNLPNTGRPVVKSACARLLDESELVTIPDLESDWRMRKIVLDSGDPPVRFYASSPIVTAEGVPLGRLCVLDVVPRSDGLTEEQARVLEVCARQVASQLELRQLRASGR